MTTVLVVEDDEDIRDLVAMLLTSRGYTILTRGDAEDVLTLAADGDVDVVLMDVSLPGRDGLETTRLIRADPAIAHLPVVLMTARTRQEDVDRGYAAGADDYIVKPFITDDLVMRLERALARRPVTHILESRTKEQDMGTDDTTTGDYGYDLTHETDPAAAAQARPQQPVQVTTETDDDGQDLSYDLSHDVPR